MVPLNKWAASWHGQILNSLHPFSEAFELMETDYFTRGDAQVLARCIDRSYDDIIIDFGELRKEIHAEWLSSDKNALLPP